MNGWILWMIAGLISLVGGILAIANPFAASMTVVVLTAWFFIVVGLLVIISAFSDQTWQARTLAIILGVLLLVLGIYMVAEPLAGSVSLTFVVAILLLATGLFRMFLGFSIEQQRIRWAFILSGVLAVILSILIFTNFPESANVVLGTFLAIDLIFNGIALLTLSMARKSLDRV